MFLFKTVHSTSIRLFCSVIYRGVESGWSVYKRQMQLGIENRVPCGWSDPGLTECRRKPVAFHWLWARSTARTYLPSRKERSVRGDESSHHTCRMPILLTCPTSSIQPVLKATVVAPHLVFICTLCWPQNAHFLTPAKSTRCLAILPMCPGSVHGQILTAWMSTWTTPPSAGQYTEQDAALQKKHQYETTWSFCLSFQDYKPSKRQAHKLTNTTSGDSVSDLFAQLVRSQFVPEQKPQTLGLQIRRASMQLKESLLNRLQWQR